MAISKKLRLIFIVGSAIPLIAYILWQLATLGAIHLPPPLWGFLAQNLALNGLLTAIRDVVCYTASQYCCQPFRSPLHSPPLS